MASACRFRGWAKFTPIQKNKKICLCVCETWGGGAGVKGGGWIVIKWQGRPPEHLCEIPSMPKGQLAAPTWQALDSWPEDLLGGKSHPHSPTGGHHWVPNQGHQKSLFLRDAF